MVEFYKMPWFTIGELVELNGLLARLHGAAIGTVVSVVPRNDGVTGLDEYKIEFEDSRQLRVWSFQLAPAGSQRSCGDRPLSDPD